jgi:hypothetical protein
VVAASPGGLIEMKSLRTLIPLALVLGLVLAAPGAGGSAPEAHASGTGAPPVAPSLVNFRIVRVEATLQRARDYGNANTAQLSKAASALAVARAQTTSAFNSAKYLIKTMPPTPAGDALDDAVVYGGPEDAAFAVLSLQHDLITAAGEMIASTTNKALRKSWFSAIAAGQAKRAVLVSFIHSHKPANPNWATVMPGLVPQLNDEVKLINGKLVATKAKGKLRKAMVAVRKQATKTRANVNKYWPPAPAG